MQYKHRWRYVAAIICIMSFCAYIFLLQPLFFSLQQLRNTEKTLIETLRSINASYKHVPASELIVSPKQRISTDVISELMQLVHQHGLVFQSGYQVVFESNEALKVNMTLQGRFAQINRFLFALHRQTHPMRIMDFTYRVDKEKGLLFSATLLVLKTPIMRSLPLLLLPETQIQDPFCTIPPFLAVPSKDDKNKLLAFPFADLRTTGFLQQGSKREVLLLLPTGDVVPVHVGMVIGKEHARVEGIENDRIMVRLASGKWVRLNEHNKDEHKQ